MCAFSSTVQWVHIVVAGPLTKLIASAENKALFQRFRLMCVPDRAVGHGLQTVRQGMWYSGHAQCVQCVHVASKPALGV